MNMRDEQRYCPGCQPRTTHPPGTHTAPRRFDPSHTSKQDPR